MAQNQEMSLINESVSSASARIRYFRIAFGAAGDQMIGPGEVTSILRDVYGNSRLDLVWQPDEPTSRSVVRLLFLSIMCLETAMPYGGKVTITSQDTKWSLSGQADKLNVNPDLWGLLAGQTPAQPPQPAHVQFAMLPLIAREERRRVHSNLGETDIEIAFEAA